MSWLEEPVSLESEFWRVLKLNREDYLLKGHFENGSYTVMFSDMCVLWEETLNSDNILERSKALNPNIEAPGPVLLKRISESVASRKSGTAFSLSTSVASYPHSLTLSLSTTLASLPFQWEFNLKQASQDTIGVHLVGPLLSMVKELNHRGEELVRLLADKDKEIQDYKEQGAEVSRKYLETAPFAEEAFKSQIISSSTFAVRAHKAMCVFDKPPIQELYKDVVKAKLWTDRNDGGINEVGETVASPVTSPVKKPPPASPSKEDEVARRRELEKKLENDKLKPKKKKRKLM